MSALNAVTRECRADGSGRTLNKPRRRKPRARESPLGVRSAYGDLSQPMVDTWRVKRGHCPVEQVRSILAVIVPVVNSVVTSNVTTCFGRDGRQSALGTAKPKADGNTKGGRRKISLMVAPGSWTGAG